MDTAEEIIQALFIGIAVATAFLQTCRHKIAIQLFNECLFLLKQHSSKLGKDYLIKQYSLIYKRLREAYKHIGDDKNAFECRQNSAEEIGDVHWSFGEHEKAKEYYTEAAYHYLVVRYVRARLRDEDYDDDGDDEVEQKRQLERELKVVIKAGDKEREGNVLTLLGNISNSLSETHEAIEYYKRALSIWEETGDKQCQATFSKVIGDLYYNVDDLKRAKQCYEHSLAIVREVGKLSELQDAVCGNLGQVCCDMHDFGMAKKFVQEALEISIKNDNKENLSNNYHNLASYCWSLKEYDEAYEYYEKSLALSQQLGDKKGEAITCSGLGDLQTTINQYPKAEATFRRALAIRVEIGDIQGEGIDSNKLAAVCHVLGKFHEAKTLNERALEIHKETGNKIEEGNVYSGLGCVYASLGDNAKAKECQEKALSLSLETKDRRAQGIDYGNLSATYLHLGDFVEAKNLHQKALQLKMEACEKDILHSEYVNLGHLLEMSGQYVDARHAYLKALEIAREVRDQKMEGVVLNSLASLELSLNELSQANEYAAKALQIMTNIREIHGESSVYKTRARLYRSFGDTAEAIEYEEKVIAISKQTGHKDDEGAAYRALGYFHACSGDHAKGVEFFNKALLISKETGDKKGEIDTYNNLGATYMSQQMYQKAQECIEAALIMADEIEYLKGKSLSFEHLAILYKSIHKIPEALKCCSNCIDILEGIRTSVGDSQRYQIAFADTQVGVYRLMASILCLRKENHMALSVLELGKARTLSELLIKLYSCGDVPSFQQLGLFDFQNVVQKYYSTCLSYLYSPQNTSIWILKANDLRFREVFDEIASAPQNETVENLIDTFARHCFRMCAELVHQQCEDRSLNILYHFPISKNFASCRFVRKEENDHGAGAGEPQWQSSLKVLHKLLIAPVADLLTGSEVIVVPDRSLFKVPFAALMTEKGEFLSEKFGIRYTPSLTTLKLIQDCPVDYHSGTGVLIVGDPDVGTVVHQGRQITFPRLPFAYEEAEMIGRLLNVHPVTGKEATKETVLQKIHSVGLIHIAAHGDADRGNIALAPSSANDDFLLTMSDISKVQLRAKLVVLSCCHSGKGEIKAEGVVEIARAFLGSGARSVLASLWGVDDEATMLFMKQFYEHLVRGTNASESLHETMKWMRGNQRCCEVRKWAPFMLIGDDVSFNFTN